MMSFGGMMTTVHAATPTPAQAALIQQSINAMSAELLQLQAQANAQQNATLPAAGATLTLVPASPATTIAPSNAAAVSKVLASLTTLLTTLQSSIAANPQMTSANSASITVALQGIGGTLSTIIAELGNGSPVAIATPTPSTAPSTSHATTPAPVAIAAPAPSTGLSATVAPAAPASNPSVAGVAPNAPANSAPVADVSSAWSWKSLDWPFIIVGILIVLAVALWLWWPEDEEDTKKKGGQKSPVTPVVTQKQQVQPTIIATTVKSAAPTSSQTPLASAVSAPVTKVIVQSPQQQQQQRKPA